MATAAKKLDEGCAPLARPSEPASLYEVPVDERIELVAVCRKTFDQLIELARVTEPNLVVKLRPRSRTSAAVRAHWLALARTFYRLRRRRSEYFDDALFAEPGWDLLLNLYIAGHEGRRVCVSGACAGSSAPTTTGLRYLTKLERKGLIVRQLDEGDARRCYVKLSVQAVHQMDALLMDAASLVDAGF